MSLHIGVARTRLSPPWGVELSGWGYYLGRIWQRVRDHTAATALVVVDGQGRGMALVAVDLMYADADFIRAVREQVSRFTDLPPSSVCVGCSHSHNTPTAALIRGAGEVDADYVAWAARQAATAVILAWKNRQPATLHVGHGELNGWTFNRTREHGPADPRVGVWRITDREGRPFAAVVGFQAHPTVQMALGPADLSRDYPGQVTDLLEENFPGLTALYFQGACGDINFRPEYNDPARCHEPGRALAEVAREALLSGRPVEDEQVAAITHTVQLPTRRWQPEEIAVIRQECEHRMRSGDTTGWLDGFARVVVNYPARLPERYGGDVGAAVQAVARFGMEWSTEALKDLEQRPEVLQTEVQALRVGDAFVVTTGSELFNTLSLEVRRQWSEGELLIVGYANDSIGYVPDAYDVDRRSYAAYQSPKFKGQFPFTAGAGSVLVQGMLDTLARVALT
jgi:hypothetical protein